MLGQVAGGSQGSDTQVSTGDTVQVQGEETEEVERDRGFEAALGLLWGERDSSVTPMTGLPVVPRHDFFFPATRLLLGLLDPVQPVAEVALGPGAWRGLSWDLWAEEGGV